MPTFGDWIPASLYRVAPALALLTIVALLGAPTPAHAQFAFGLSVAVSDNEVLIGEPGNRVTPGYVYVYRQADDGWTEVQRLSRSGASNSDGFGQAIVVDGNRLLIGATSEAGGAVHVFERGDDGWMETGRFGPDEVAADGSFGGALAVSGDLAIVGAQDREGKAGAAFVFALREGAWTQVAELAPDGGATEMAADDEEAETETETEEAPKPAFGSAVAIDGDWAMVGAPTEAGMGSVYVFRREDDSWHQVAKLPTGSGGPPGAQNRRAGAAFGSTILMRDGQALVGAIGANGIGAVRSYELDDEGESWVARGSLLPFDGTPGYGFGSSIVLTENEVLVGAPGAGRGLGRVYRFVMDADGNVTEATKLGTAALGFGAGFAASLAGDGSLLVAGSPGDDLGAGTATIMDRSLGGFDRTKVFSEASGLDPVVGGAIECSDGMAGMFPCDKFDLISFLPNHLMDGGRGAWANDVWGWTDPETGHDYALVGLSARTSFVDVTDPYNPIYVGNLPKTPGTPDSLWRDMKVYADHVFVVADAAAEHGVQIFDLTRLREFAGEPIEFEVDVQYEQVNSAHNIVINEQTAFAYVVGASGGGETCGGGLHMINIEDPKQPIFAGCFADVRSGRRGTGYSHDAQCVVYHGPDERYSGKELCFGSNETALSIADVSDKRNPVAVSMATYPNVAYSHQGWLTDDQRYFYMNDEGDEASGTVEGTRTLIFDVQELDDPILLGEYIHDVQAIDHNLYVVGNRMYQSNYNAGLRVLDITDPENLEMAGYFDTVPWDDNGVEYDSFSWSNYPFFDNGFILVTSIREGLFIVREQGNEATANSRGSGSRR